MSLLFQAVGSAPVTQWGPRLTLSFLVLAVVALGVAGMRRGWHRRMAQQSHLLAPPTPPSRLPDDIHRIRGHYVATTRAGDLLDRVVAHGLGHRGVAHLVVLPGGLLFERQGEQAVWIPVGDLRGVRLGSGQAQRAFEAGGLLLVEWALGDEMLESGFRAERPEEHVEAARAIASMVPTREGIR